MPVAGWRRQCVEGMGPIMGAPVPFLCLNPRFMSLRHYNMGSNAIVIIGLVQIRN